MSESSTFAARRILVVAGFLLAFVLLFWPTFVWMAERFNTHDSFYSHGWLVPAASAWLIWQRRERLLTTAHHPNGWGLALLMPSLLVHVVATWLDLHVLSGLAMLGALWGLVWTCWGWRTLSCLRAPLLFLLFMVPLPSILLIAISFKMKLMAAWMAAKLVSFVGIPVAQAGSTLHLPGGLAVVVDDTCSGLRSLISLLALSTLWTSLMPPASARWKKWLLTASSMPIALVANMVRIVSLVVLCAIYGPQVAAGFIHYGSGIVVFGVAILALAWLSRVLTRVSPPLAASHG
jgi:exosortase